MGVLLDILIYAFFAFAMSFMAKQSLLGVEKDKFSIKWLDPWLWLYILFFTYISATRWFVGTDNVAYAFHFHNGLEEVKNGEILWGYLANFVHDNGYHWTIGEGISAFLQIFFLTEALKRYRYLLVFFPFVLFGGRLWMDLSGAVRQMIVACALLWAARFVVNKKYIYYLIFVYVAAKLHHSAVFLIVLIVIPPKLSLVRFRYILMGIVFVCFIAGQTPAFNNLVEPFKAIVETTDYSEEYGDNMIERLATGESEETLSFGPMMLSYLLLPMSVLYAGPVLKRKLGLHIPEFDLWYNMTFLYAVLYFLFCNLGHIFIRPILYLSVFQVAMVAMLLYYLWMSRSKSTEMKLICYAFCIIVALNTVWDVKKAHEKSFEVSTYKSIYFHEEEIESVGL